MGNIIATTATKKNLFDSTTNKKIIKIQSETVNTKAN
jgi:hypothetical protein